MVSVAMATYNGSKYIKEQIDSILSQTYRDFELIITDDCSTDNTFEILSEYAQKDSRIRLVRNDKNLGFVRNFEIAITLCKGDYVAFADQDDIWDSNHIDTLLKKIGNKPLVCGNCNLIDGDGKDFGMTYKYQEALDYMPEDNIRVALSILYFRNPCQGSSMLVTQEFLSKALPIPEEVRFHDAWFATLACFMGGFNYLDDITGCYRMHGSNASGCRTTRMSKISNWYELGRHGVKGDRIPYINAILERVESLSKIEISFLQESRKRFTKAHGILRPLQKLSNWLYITRNYKAIFSIK